MADAEPEKPHHLGHRKRLRERVLAAGPGALPDYELLEFLLFSAQPRGDTKPLAKRLIDHFGGFAATISAPNEALLAQPEVGEAAVAALAAVREAALRLVRNDVVHREVLSSWQSVLDYCTARMAYGSIEEFRILFLDRKNALIADEAQQRGTVDHTPVYPREVVKRALELGASALIMMVAAQLRTPDKAGAALVQGDRVPGFDRSANAFNNCWIHIGFMGPLRTNTMPAT